MKRERERSSLSISEVAQRSGLDRAVVSRLENGKLANPTVATLMRYAAAVGQRFLWAYEPLPSTVEYSNDKVEHGRRLRRSIDQKRYSAANDARVIPARSRLPRLRGPAIGFVDLRDETAARCALKLQKAAARVNA